MNVHDYAQKLNNGKLKTKVEEKRKSSVERYAEKHAKHKQGKADGGNTPWTQSEVTM